MYLSCWKYIDRKGCDLQSMMRFHLAKNHSAAFSLIELCLVLAGMAILGAFSVPMLNSAMRSMQLSAETRKIATTLTNARLSASSHTNPYRIVFNQGANSWQLERYDQDENDFVAYEAENTLSAGLANSGIELKGGTQTEIAGFPLTSSEFITFNARGFPIDSTGAPTAGNVIYLAGSNTEFAITVSLTGKVQVLKNEDSGWTTCH